MEHFSPGSGVWNWLFNLISSITFSEFTGIALLLLTGFFITHMLGPKLPANVKLAVSFPVGFGTIGIIVFVLAVLNISLSNTITILTIVTVVAGILPTNNILKKNSFADIKSIISPKELKAAFININLLYIGALVIVSYIILAFIFKTLYWPVFDWDAITTFDFYGRSIFQENTLIPKTMKEGLLGSGISYPPLTHLLIAYSYLIGLSSPKIIYIIVFLSTAFGLYSMIRVQVNKLPAILAVLVLITTPEFISFAGLVKTNSIQVMYSSIGIMSFINFYKTKYTGYLYLSIVMISLNAWVRSEGIEFILILSILLFFMWYQKQTSLKNLLLFCLITPVLFVSWQIFLKINIADFASYIQVELIPYPFYDADKISKILNSTWKLMISTRYYGFTFYFAITIFILNSVIYRKQGNYLIFIIIAMIMILHIAILYQFHYKLNNMGWLLTHSYKRYFFNYIPLVCFFIFSSNIMKTIFNKYESLISIRK